MLIALLFASTSNHLIRKASPGSAKVSFNVCRKVANIFDLAELIMRLIRFHQVQRDHDLLVCRLAYPKQA